MYINRYTFYSRRRNTKPLYPDTRSRSLFGILKIDLLVGSTLIHFPLNSKDAVRCVALLFINDCVGDFRSPAA